MVLGVLLAMAVMLALIVGRPHGLLAKHFAAHGSSGG